MATSRTGTSKGKRFRQQVIRAAQDAGVTRCPNCLTELDYDQPYQPNSAEADHIVPHAKGGEDTADNGRVVCRRCNQSRGASDALSSEAVDPFPLSRAW